MELEIILFGLFYLSVIASALSVINETNPVHSVLFLILTFISAAGLLFLLEVEFISLIFIVVYVGAIAVLFLFVVMMLDIKISELTQEYSTEYVYIGNLIFVAFGLQIFLILDEVLTFGHETLFHSYDNLIEKVDSLADIQTLGQILYTSFFPYFLIAGIILLVAMLGAVVLTLSFSRQSKTQLISKQVSRNFMNATFSIKTAK